MNVKNSQITERFEVLMVMSVRITICVVCAVASSISKESASSIFSVKHLYPSIPAVEEAARKL